MTLWLYRNYRDHQCNTDITNSWKMYPVNTKQLYNICTILDQRRRHWVDVVQMLYNCFVFAGYKSQNVGDSDVSPFTHYNFHDGLIHIKFAKKACK